MGDAGTPSDRPYTVAFDTALWRHQGEAAWYFVTLPHPDPPRVRVGPRGGDDRRVGDALFAGLDEFDVPRGSFLLARSDESTVACGAIQRIDDDTSEIKRMWVHAGWRGLGVGRRMLAALEAYGAELGYRRILLDTLRCGVVECSP